MATLKQVRDKANAKLETFWGALSTRQDSYFAKHGKYFQLLVGSELTQDGADTSFSVVLPSDETNIIDIDTSWTDTVPFQLSVHSTNGPDGHSYIGRVRIKHNEDIYQRTRDSFGNDSGWNLLTM